MVAFRGFRLCRTHRTSTRVRLDYDSLRTELGTIWYDLRVNCLLVGQFNEQYTSLTAFRLSVFVISPRMMMMMMMNCLSLRIEGPHAELVQRVCIIQVYHTKPPRTRIPVTNC